MFKKNMLKGIFKKMFAALSLLIATTSLAFALDVNTANQVELDGIKGIGPVKAKAIIEERNKNGNFKDAHDLSSRVKGLGDKSVAKLISSGLTVSGKADASSNIAKPKEGFKKDHSSASAVKQSNVSGIGDGTNKNVKSSVSAPSVASKPVLIKSPQEAKHEKAEAKSNSHGANLNANIKNQKDKNLANNDKSAQKTSEKPAGHSSAVKAQ